MPTVSALSVAQPVPLTPSSLAEEHVAVQRALMWHLHAECGACDERIMACPEGMALAETERRLFSLRSRMWEAAS